MTVEEEYGNPPTTRHVEVLNTYPDGSLLVRNEYGCQYVVFPLPVKYVKVT